MASASAPRVGNEFWAFNPDARRGAGEYRYNWRLILPAAAEVVNSYTTTGVTLRQLFYRLVAAEMLPNTAQSYGSLSAKTAEARRSDGFPALIDNNRSIDRPNLWEDADDAAEWMIEQYMEDRSITQEVNLYVAAEKNGLKAQLFQWFAGMGLPVLALGGYASQTLCDEVYEDAQGKHRKGKPNILIYAGDFDADGEDIPRDFDKRAGCFDKVVRVALNPDQVESMQLPPQPGKWTSARAQGFARKYGDLFESVYGYDLVQIELDAIPPTDLRQIYLTAIDEYFDYDAWRERVAHEDEQKARIESIMNEEG
jgi:hypothetical protein